MKFRRALRSSGVATLTAVALGAFALPDAAASNSILFVGNSLTYGDPGGAAPVVQYYRPGTVTDLNGTGIGGIPALFKAFTTQVGLDYNVSLETAPNVGLDYHYNNKYNTIVRPFDTVVLQPKAADPAAKFVQYSGLLAQAFLSQNPNANIRLTSTWTFANQTYLPTGAVYGQPITAMALILRRYNDAADAASDFINGVIPVGQAWNRAFESGLADTNPYNGIGTGQIDLWAPDAMHASIYGYYLEGLTIFGNVTGFDPRFLGSNEFVARDLGISGAVATSLQQIAFEQLASEKVPEPSTIVILLTAGGLMSWIHKRSASKT